MDRTSLLAQRERSLVRIAQADMLLAHQYELVDRMRSTGRPTARAEALLRELQAAQASYLEGLSRIDRELANSLFTLDG